MTPLWQWIRNQIIQEIPEELRFMNLIAIGYVTRLPAAKQ
jgi:hypothetical protein